MKRIQTTGGEAAAEIDIKKLAKWAAVGLAGFILLLVVGCGGAKEFSRYQKRADAKNATWVRNQEIKTYQARVLIERKKAQVRREEAKGLHDAQETIQATLTDRYLQHEAIGAMREIAASGRNNSLIYLPSGPMGVPLVQDVTSGTTRGTAQTTPNEEK